MIHNHSSGKCRSAKRFFAVCMAVLFICMISLNSIAAETDESVSNTATEEVSDVQEVATEETEETQEEEATGVEAEEKTEMDGEVEICEEEPLNDEEEEQDTVLLSDGMEEIEIGQVKIRDAIRTTGNLLLEVTDQNGETVTAEQLKESGYSIVWYGDGEEVQRNKITGDSFNMAEDGSWLNVTLDEGAQKIYQVQIKKGDQMIVSQEYQVPYYDALRNGSFETPECTDRYQPFITGDSQGIIWKTTASDNMIEIVSAAQDKRDGNATHQSLSVTWHGMSAAAEGTQYAELNANRESSLYQDVLTTPGSVMHWQLAHAARLKNGNKTYRGADQMYVVIMDADKAETLSRNQSQLVKVAKALAAGQTVVDGTDYSGAGSFLCTNSTGIWSIHNGSYSVPEGQYLTRYFFVSAASASGDMTIGNHIDNVWFSTELPPVNPDLTTTVSVRKEVKGPMGDVQKEFPFTYSYETGDGQTVTGTFALRDYDTDGQTCTFQEIPVGTMLVLTEGDARGYETTAHYNGQEVQNISGGKQDAEKTIKILVGSEEGLVMVTNYKDVIPDTGITMSRWPFEILLFLTLASALLSFTGKKKTLSGIR